MKLEPTHKSHKEQASWLAKIQMGHLRTCGNFADLRFQLWYLSSVPPGGVPAVPAGGRPLRPPHLRRQDPEDKHHRPGRVRAARHTAGELLHNRTHTL